MERQLNVRMAPHLVKPLKMVIPTFDGEHPDRLVGLALGMYDVMAVPSVRERRRRKGDPDPDLPADAADWSPERHREITGDEVVELMPALEGRNPTAGFLFYDCQTDDVRLVLSAIDEASKYGAVCVNGVEAKALLESGGRAIGVRAVDTETGEEFEVKAAHVVNATGVWADQLRPDELRDEAELPRIRPSRGTHILIDQKHLPLVAGAIVPAGEGRSIFALPWLGRTLIGTTDSDYEADQLEHVPPSEGDVDYLLDAVNDFFGTEIGAADIVGAFAGVRPLIAPAEGKRSVDISRKAELFETSSGMITITGGKLTTWRAMAEDTVDRIVEREGGDVPCRTKKAKIGAQIDPAELPRVEGVTEDAYEALAGRYGAQAADVLEVARERGTLAQPIVGDLPDLLAEAIWAARHQQARTLSDVLFRRTRLALLAGRELCEPQSAALARLADVLGDELGWDATEREQQIAAFLKEAQEEGICVTVKSAA